MEAEARCAAALAALRQARGLPGRADAQAVEKGAPQGALEMAREGLTAARDLATSLCTILDGEPGTAALRCALAVLALHVRCAWRHEGPWVLHPQSLLKLISLTISCTLTLRIRWFS